MVRAEVRDVLNGYIVSPALEEGIDGYIVPPSLGADAGVCGALALALDAFHYRDEITKVP